MIDYSKIDAFMKTCIMKNGKFNTRRFNEHKDLYCENLLKELKIEKPKDLFYLWKNNIQEIPKCKICGKQLKNFYKNYTYCSRKCMYNDPEYIENNQQSVRKSMYEKYGVEYSSQMTDFKEKIQQTSMKHFGVKHSSLAKEVQEKRKKTCLKKYNAEHPSQNKEIKEKKKKTCLKKFGVEYALQSKEVQEKRKITNKEKYGVENVFQSLEIKKQIKKSNKQKFGYEYASQSQEIQEKTKQTNKEKFGYEYALQSPEIQEKTKQTCLKRYGVDHPWKSKEVQEKVKKTNIEKYGFEFTTQSQEIKDKFLYTHRKNIYDKHIKQLKETKYTLLSTKEEFIHNRLVKYQHNCGTIFETNATNIQDICCPHCQSLYITSIKEKEVLNFIKSIYTGTIIENDRKILNGKELDIYIPEYNLAIEFDGKYWHNSKFVTKTYHQEKSLLCLEKGIRLIHIFEWEWDKQRNKIEYLIKSALNQYEHQIDINNCIIKNISQNEYIRFLEINHLQKSIHSSIRYGLFYDNELISVIGFDKSKCNKNEIELYRYCSKLGYQIDNGFNKLISFSNIKHFITFVDISHYNLNNYIKTRFKKIELTQPDYKWVKGNQIITEHLNEEQMLKNGYDKIYNSGYFKLAFDFSL